MTADDGMTRTGLLCERDDAHDLRNALAYVGIPAPDDETELLLEAPRYINRLIRALSVRQQAAQQHKTREV